MKTTKAKYDYIVVGSGAGGGTMVRELAKQGKEVLCVEWGAPVATLGTILACHHLYDSKRLPDFFPRSIRKLPWFPPTTPEGTLLWRAITPGGSTVISMGNGGRCLENELDSMGIDLTREYGETESDIGLQPIEDHLISPGSRKIQESAELLGHDFRPMPKYIDPEKCQRCQKCIYGCQYGAKWDTRAWLTDAAFDGANFLYDTKVLRVTSRQGRVTGVIAQNSHGEEEILGNHVILCAGGMASPAILQRSGIEEAGEGFFLDLFRNTFGVIHKAGLEQTTEPNMAMVDLEWFYQEGFMLSSYMNKYRLTRLQEMNPFRALHSSKQMMGIMTKISDDANGHVYIDGTCSKPLTPRDRQRLERGSELAREILIQAGADPRSLFESKIQGAHPGGGAAIGEVVDRDLQTRIDNLFVCDASVLPAREFNSKSRLPPILTIIALAKRLSKSLN